jgi:hypothetical protein
VEFDCCIWLVGHTPNVPRRGVLLPDHRT